MYDQLLLAIKKHQKKPLIIIGIDGPGGVGKTTLASNIKKSLRDVQIVHMDDFDVPTIEKMNLSSHRPVGPDTRWNEVFESVILPLRNGMRVYYKKYDRKVDKYTRRVNLKPEGILVIEGVYALRRELISHYDFSIWVDCVLDVRVSRAIARDGEVSRDLWEKDWLPMEEKYISIYKPNEYADLIYRTD